MSKYTTKLLVVTLLLVGGLSLSADAVSAAKPPQPHAAVAAPAKGTQSKAEKSASCKAEAQQKLLSGAVLKSFVNQCMKE